LGHIRLGRKAPLALIVGHEANAENPLAIIKARHAHHAAVLLEKGLEFYIEKRIAGRGAIKARLEHIPLRNSRHSRLLSRPRAGTALPDRVLAQSSAGRRAARSRRAWS